MSMLPLSIDVETLSGFPLRFYRQDDCPENNLRTAASSWDLAPPTSWPFSGTHLGEFNELKQQSQGISFHRS